MKRFFITALACAAMLLPAAAQWNPGDYSQTKIEKIGRLQYASPKMIRKADGSTILAYRSFGVQTDPTTGEPTPDQYFYLHLQMLDQNGNKLWGDRGILVSTKKTDSASFGYVNLDTLPNGNIILTHEDSRDLNSDLAGLSILNLKETKIIAYCYDQQGNSVWSPDGVMLPFHRMDEESLVTAYAAEKIAISGDKIYMAAKIMEQYVHSEPGEGGKLVPTDIYVHYFEVACFDFNGNKIGEERIDSTNNAFIFELAPAPDGDAYIIYVNEHDGYSAQRIGSDCQTKWTSVVETDNVVSREPSGAYAVPPSDVIPMNDGSVGMIYYAFIGRSWSKLCYNRLYPDGTLLNDHVIISDTTGTHHAYTMMVEGDTLNIFETYAHNRTELGEFYLYFNQIKLDGTRILPTVYGYWLDETTGYDHEPLCMVKADGNYNVLVSANDCYAETYPAYCYTISPDGKLFQRKPIISDDWYISNYDCVIDNNYVYLAHTRYEFGTGGLWISCIDATDYTNSVELTGELPGKFTVSADGKQVNFSKGNLTYLPYRQTYNFAVNQFDTRVGFNKWIAENSMDWMDLFGWGTGNNPILTSTNDADYPSFNDWGDNAIMNSLHEAGIWRAMTKDEWDYLLNGRAGAAQKRAIGQIELGIFDGVRGLFILPDDFEMPQGLQMDMDAHQYETNTYSDADFHRLEAAGVVMIPAGGYRSDTTVYELNPMTPRGVNGYYWMATESDANYAQAMIIDMEGPSFIAQPRSRGFSVRLVKDAEEGPQGIEDIVADKKDNRARKVLIDGVLYILRDGRIYNATGAQVR